MEIKSINPKLTQSGIAEELKLASSTIQQYRREVKVLLSHRIPQSSNTLTRKQKTSNYTEHELKLTSNDLRSTSPQMNQLIIGKK